MLAPVDNVTVLLATLLLMASQVLLAYLLMLAPIDNATVLLATLLVISAFAEVLKIKHH
jgi:hypothetical protein